MTIASVAHASNQIVCLQNTVPIGVAVLTALVGMNHHCLLWLTSPPPRQQCISSQIAGELRLDWPANDLTRKQIQHHIQGGDIPGIEVRRQAFPACIGQGNCLVLPFEAQDGRHRAEGIFATHSRIVRDIHQDDWREKVALQPALANRAEH